MIKKIEKEDYEKIVKLLKQKNQEYILENEFSENFSFVKNKNSDIRNAKNLIMLKLKLNKEKFLEQKSRYMFFRKIDTILKEMDFENCLICFNTKGTECLIFQGKLD